MPDAATPSAYEATAAERKAFLGSLAPQVAKSFALPAAPPPPVVKRVHQHHPRKVYSVSWGGDSVHLASTGQDGNVLVTNADTGLLASLPLPVPGKVLQTAISADMRVLAAGSMDNKVRFYERGGQGAPLESRASHAATATHDGYVSSLKFVANGVMMLSGSGDGTAVLWDVARAAAVQTFAGHEADVTGIAVGDGGAGPVFGTSSVDKSVRVWDKREPCAVRVFGAKYSANCCAFLPHGRAIACGCDSASWELFDVGSYNQVARGKVKRGRCEAIAVSSSGRLVYTGWDDNKLVASEAYSPGEMVEVETAHAAGTPYGAHAGSISALELSPDGSALASASFDGTVKVWGPPDVASRAPDEAASRARV